MTSVNFVQWQDFSKVQLKMVWKEYAAILPGKVQTECRNFSIGKAELLSSHHLCLVQFPKDLTFKLALHGSTNKWKPENKWAKDLQG